MRSCVVVSRRRRRRPGGRRRLRRCGCRRLLSRDETNLTNDARTCVHSSWLKLRALWPSSYKNKARRRRRRRVLQYSTFSRWRQQRPLLPSSASINKPNLVAVKVVVVVAITVPASAGLVLLVVVVVVVVFVPCRWTARCSCVLVTLSCPLPRRCSTTDDLDSD